MNRKLEWCIKNDVLLAVIGVKGHNKKKTGGEGAWPVNIIKVRNMPLILYFVICFVIPRLFVLKYEEKIATFTQKQMRSGGNATRVNGFFIRFLLYPHHRPWESPFSGANPHQVYGFGALVSLPLNCTNWTRQAASFRQKDA